jgi:hypothetical protein
VTIFEKGIKTEEWNFKTKPLSEGAKKEIERILRKTNPEVKVK